VRRQRARLWLGLAAVLCCGVLALNAQWLALAGIHGYQRTVSPLATRIGLRCRFTPTCSRYAETVIARDGAVRGGWKALRRIARCGPWTAMGTSDPP
jgi:putative membrane protein insertion efficiency factor